MNKLPDHIARGEADREPVPTVLRQAIREATGPRLMERGFSADIVSKLDEVKLFFNDANGNQTTFILPGQAFRRNDLESRFGFDVANGLFEENRQHFILSDEGLFLKEDLMASEMYPEGYSRVDDSAAYDMTAKMSEAETLLTVTLVSDLVMEQ